MFDHDDAEDGFDHDDAEDGDHDDGEDGDHDDAEDGRRVILLRRGVDYLVPTLPPPHVASLLLFLSCRKRYRKKAGKRRKTQKKYKKFNAPLTPSHGNS